MALLKLRSALRELRKVWPETRHALVQINKMMNEVDPFYTKWVWLNAIVSGLMGLGMFATVGVLLQQALNRYAVSRNISVRFVIIAVVGIVAFFASKMVLSVFSHWRESVFDQKVEFLVSEQFSRKLLSLDLGRITDPEFIATKEAAEQRGENAIGRLFSSQMTLLSSLVGIVVSLGIISVLDPVLLAIAIVPVIPDTLKTAIFNGKRRRLWESNHLIRRRKREYGYVLSDKDTLVQAKLFRFTDHVWSRFHHFLKELRDSEITFQTVELKSDMWIGMIGILLLGCAMAYLGKDLIDHKLTIAKLYFIFGCVQTFSSSLSSATRTVTNLADDSRTYGYMERFFSTQPLVDESNARDIVLERTPMLELQNVSFAYPRQVHKSALNSCCLTIAANERVALVGKNGSGKTTVLRLLSKVFIPETGEVCIDGETLTAFRQDSWLRHLLYVTQDSVLPDFPIAEAVAGTDPGLVDMARLKQAAHLAGADEFIEELPQQYLTQIGEDWPGGVGFSSGQRQRLKLASAFYRLLDPEVKIALFDEPMAHCDVETRERFYQALTKIAGKTIILVAHDPMYLHYFERVVVMENGRVVEEITGPEAIEGYKHEIAFSLSADL